MGQHSDFDDAVKSANGKLTDSSKFILAIDVKRARHSGIRPVPQRVLNGQIWEIEEDTAYIIKIRLMPPRKVSIHTIYPATKRRRS